MDARALFAAIAPRYDGPAEVLSFGRYARWRRELVRALGPTPGQRVLDVATGTGLIAHDIAARYRCTVVGVDLSGAMLARDRSPAGPRVVADADALPFPDGSFDTVVFSYLLRYVPDPAATLDRLARALRPGGTLASVEFGMPGTSLPRLGWRLWARGAFPTACRLFGPGWRDVGAFLPGSIETWARAWPPERQEDAWTAAGMTDVTTRALTFGAGVVMTGRRR